MRQLTRDRKKTGRALQTTRPVATVCVPRGFIGAYTVCRRLRSLGLRARRCYSGQRFNDYSTTMVPSTLMKPDSTWKMTV